MAMIGKSAKQPNEGIASAAAPSRAADGSNSKCGSWHEKRHGIHGRRCA